VQLRWTTADSDLGWILVAATPRGLAAVRLDDDDAVLEARFRAWAARARPGLTPVRDDDGLTAALEIVRAAGAGQPVAVDLPHALHLELPLELSLDLVGTPFQARVWAALRAIPRGEVRTYGAVARAVGAPRAARAVGSACGANPVAIVVPCHRVVPAGGGVGSYAYGADRKRLLLRREGWAGDRAGDRAEGRDG
jgi:AraC family transcriptional regulator of adaptative response/methylated-DNA-[protein]-cysteine methyltransferase